jgi:diguanylate cyclase (GGDEF)-like protein
MDAQPAAASIIAIEDDPNVAALLTRRIARAGYDVHHATTIHEGRELLERIAWDVLILDRGLPDGDGVDLCWEVRGKAPHAYILMLTGESSDEAKLEGFDCGADDYVTKPCEPQELLARIRAGLRIVDLQKKLIATNKRLEELTLTDELTDLRNRRAFEQELSTRFDAARRYDRPLSLMILDLDLFKSINDEHGHPAGDEVLRAVARILERSSRHSDFVARIGGEEFAIILPEASLFEAIQYAEKMRATVAAAEITHAGKTMRVTISAGIANMPHSHARTLEDLVAAADEALYRAKEGGRNRVELERRRARNTIDATSNA